jgi:hypothetical protein
VGHLRKASTRSVVITISNASQPQGVGGVVAEQIALADIAAQREEGAVTGPIHDGAIGFRRSGPRWRDPRASCVQQSPPHRNPANPLSASPPSPPHKDRSRTWPCQLMARKRAPLSILAAARH